MSEQAVEYYASRSRRLLRDFDKVVRETADVFEARYGVERTDAMVRQAREEYLRLIPGIPYVGGRQPFTRFLVASAWFLAMYRALSQEGRGFEEAGELTYEASKRYLERVPGFARRFLGRVSSSARYLDRLRERAEESQHRRYPGDYVFTYVDGDGTTFDYGVDYQECATWKFRRAQGASGLAPYLRAVDYLYSEMLGWGLVRTLTLAEGNEKRDFRFKKGGPTRIRCRGSSICPELAGHLALVANHAIPRAQTLRAPIRPRETIRGERFPIKRPRSPFGGEEPPERVAFTVASGP